MKPCRGRDLTLAYSLGHVRPEQVDSIAEHVDSCTDCQATLASAALGDDTLITHLRAAAHKKPVYDEPEFKQAVRSARSAIAGEITEQLAVAGEGTIAQPAHPSRDDSMAQEPRKLDSTKPGGKMPRAEAAPGSASMPVSLDQFAKGLETTGLLTAEEFAAFQSAHSATSASNVQAIAQSLVQAGKLTKFQAAHILQGKAKGLLFGEYLVVDKLGAGGMGQVFRARHRRMKRMVAIKVLPPAAVKTPDAVRRFQREVEAAAKLVHQNIVIAHDAGEAQGLHYLAMEYVEGQDLSSLVKQRGALPVAEAVDYIAQAARGLAFAHSEGVIHRDIKPANLLLDKKGIVKILDMGLARFDDTAAAMSEGLTQSGQVMGTVDYMAPEQAFDTRHADARSDIYSLGCTLYRLLTGESVFGGETMMQKFLAHREAPIPDLCAKRPDAPAALGMVFARMMAKKPEERYATMEEVISALEAIRAIAPAQKAAVGDRGHSLAPSSTDAGIGDATAAWQAARMPTIPTADPPHQKTLGAAAAEIETDPQSQLVFAPIDTTPKRAKSPRGRKAPAKSPKGGQPPWRNRKLLAAAGGGAAFVLAGIIILLRSPDGETTKMEVPADVAVTIADSQGRPLATIPAAKPGKPAAVSATTRPGTLPPLLVAPFDYRQARAGQQAWASYLGTYVKVTNKLGMDLTLIPPGTFLMGSTPEQIAAAEQMARAEKLDPKEGFWISVKQEAPQHQVTITRPFWMAATETTVGQFKKFVEATKYVTQAEEFGFGTSSRTTFDASISAEQKKASWRTPGYGVSDDLPVTQVTWNDAVRYCNWLSEQEGVKPYYAPDGNHSWKAATDASGALGASSALSGYRLPTEAEWEYACRAGSTGQFSFGDDPALLDEHGWFRKNAANHPHPVAAKLANAFGLFDMHGNVWEWCQDYWSHDYYAKSPQTDPSGPASGVILIMRGGFYYHIAAFSRSASRANANATQRHFFNGFRVVRSIDAATSKQNGDGRGRLAFRDPAFQKWVADTQKLPAEKQIEAVSKKLMELNPGFDGRLLGWGGDVPPKIENGIVTHLSLVTDQVTDISPLRAFSGLQRLKCRGSAHDGKLSDLSPLEGLPIEHLDCSANTELSDLKPLGRTPITILTCNYTAVTDLSPLRGTPITTLTCGGGPLADLSSLSGMKLSSLNINGSKTMDLSPLRGMPLKQLSCGTSSLADISPLLDCKQLTLVNLPGAEKVGRESVAALQKALPGCKIFWDGETKARTPDKQPPAANGQFVSLFNGRDLSGWKVIGFGGWSVKDGTLVGVTSQEPGWLMSEREFQDYELKLEFKLPAGGNSGIFLHAFPEGDVTGRNFHELQLLDDAAPQYANVSAHARNGALFGVTAPSSQPHAPAEAWNKLNVVVQREHLQASINGQPVLDTALPPGKPSRGRIGLQLYKPAGASFRNIQVREIEKTHEQPLADTDPAFQEWVAETQKLPAEKQLEAVSKKLMELNPGFDGRLAVLNREETKAIPGGAEAKLQVINDEVIDLSPLRGLARLVALDCAGTGRGQGRLRDLSPLTGLPLVFLKCGNTAVSDLKPLAGMPLADLHAGGTLVTDISPLAGLPLVNLQINDTQVSDLSPLARCLDLTNLFLHRVPVSDISPLVGLNKLALLGLVDAPVDAASLAEMKRANPGCQIEWPKPGRFYTPTKLAYTDPAFQQWVMETRKLPADKQLEVVSKKLMELNPGFDGKVLASKIEGGMITSLGLAADKVADISPLRALSGLKQFTCTGSQADKSGFADLSPLEGLPLTSLTCHHTQVADLAPLAGMKLATLNCNTTDVSDLTPLAGMRLGYLDCGNTPVSDLSPLANMNLTALKVGSTNVSSLSFLQGMPLTSLECHHSQITDLSPLRGMKLQKLCCYDTRVSDLSPLRGIPLKDLRLFDTAVRDLTPLEGMNLAYFTFTPKKITKGLDVLRQMKSVEFLGVNGSSKLPPAEFWKKYDAGGYSGKKIAYIEPAFQQWVTETQKLPGEKQIEAVSKKLMELNPGFDGKVTGNADQGTPKIVDGVVTEFGFSACEVSDISPVRALPGLKALSCTGHGPRRGKIADLTPLEGMQLERLICSINPISDLSPLHGMPLEVLYCHVSQVSDLSPLEGMPLTGLNLSNTEVADLSPLRGMKLRDLNLGASRVADISVLSGMPLVSVHGISPAVADLSPLEKCRGLKTLSLRGTKATAAQVAALQKALPTCKIEWDSDKVGK